MAFSFVQVTDLHLSLGDSAYGEGQGDATYWIDGEGLHDRIVTTPEVLSALFDEIAALSPDFVVATGDLTNTGSDAELAAYAEIVAKAPVRVVSIPGNHDHDNQLTPNPAYEARVGSRWFSFDHDGVHFAAIDWFTWRTRHDHREQEEWLAADLSALPAGTPVVLLTHDQMSSSFYDRLPVRPIASFSGHWHTTRVVESAGTVHYNTGTATFGGLDYSPAQYRVATWDGQHLDVRTVARPAGVGLGPAHPLAEPEPVGEGSLVVSRDEDGPGGSLERRTGDATDWVVPFGSAVKAPPLVVGDVVVAVSVEGEVACVDVATGAEHWRTRLHDDPLRLWVHLRPATDGTRVFVGDVDCFCALDLATGQVVWRRSDLGQRENLTSFSHPALVDHRLLVAFAAQDPALWALDPATGATLWPYVEQARCVYACPPEELPVLLPRVVMAGLTPDPDGEDVYVVRLGARLDRIRAATGEVVWSAPTRGWFNPVPPVVWDDVVLVVESYGALHCIGRDGTPRWVADLDAPAPQAMGPYRADGPVLLSPPVLDGDHVEVTAVGGATFRISRSGAVTQL